MSLPATKHSDRSALGIIPAQRLSGIAEYGVVRILVAVAIASRVVKCVSVVFIEVCIST